MAEPSVGRGAADRVIPEVDVDWRRPGQRCRSATEEILVASIDRARQRALESLLGARLPSDFLATLSNREPIREGDVVLLAHDREWDIRTTFTLDDGHQSDQLDTVYKLVGDVLPDGMLPFAEDWGGNLYCIVLRGNSAGKVVWWDHERDIDDDSVVPIAESIAELYSKLVPDPRD